MDSVDAAQPHAPPATSTARRTNVFTLTPATDMDRVAGFVRCASTNLSLSAGLPE